MNKIILYSLTFFIALFLPKPIFAQQQNDYKTNQFVTVVNPLRISKYSSDPKGSLMAQYSQVQKRNLAATWLLNYDILLDPGIVSVAKEMDESQELGLFLEVTPNFAKEAGVAYSKTDSWHRANAVFLSGYTQADRNKLIDKIFGKFKETFGLYPTSVGAWWVDSYSLNYMKEKYNITANLTCADQFATDGYQLWGQYWSIPFYPSKLHAGMPASNLDSKLDLVTIQWAAREPVNGYGRKQASLFSTQDYFDIDYFQKLIDVYAKSNNNKFGQMTVGLEGDFPPNSYGNYFASQLERVKSEKDKGLISVVTMKDFSSWYRGSFSNLSPVQVIKADEFLGKKVKAFWYNSPHYRINITYNSDTKETVIRDFRTYHDNFQEPYYISPNRDINLSINLPSQIDSAGSPEEEWKVFIEELENISDENGILALSYKNNNQIKLTEEKIEIYGKVRNIPISVLESSLLRIKNPQNLLSMEIRRNWNYPIEGLIFRDLTQEATNFLKQRKIIAGGIVLILFLSALLFFISKKQLPINVKMVIVSVLILILGVSIYNWYLSNSKVYFVNQSELDALNRLKVMKGNKIVVVDKVCLQCEWHTPLIPAIFANKRGYVEKVSGKKIVYNSSIFNAKTRPEAKKELDKLNADYIYLVRFEDYVELAPFSPGDLNIEEVYSNANTQIWKVKKD